MTNYRDEFMQRAVALSQAAVQSGRGLPIGCVIVKNNVIIGEGHNEVFVRSNPTAHAEMVAIENACKNTASPELEGCELYTSLEPCPMCFGAIYWAKIKTVYFAGSQADATEAGFEDSCIAQEFVKPAHLQKIPMHHVSNAMAIQVLQSWQRSAASQKPGS